MSNKKFSKKLIIHFNQNLQAHLELLFFKRLSTPTSQKKNGLIAETEPETFQVSPVGWLRLSAWWSWCHTIYYPFRFRFWEQSRCHLQGEWKEDTKMCHPTGVLWWESVANFEFNQSVSRFFVEIYVLWFVVWQTGICQNLRWAINFVHTPQLAIHTLLSSISAKSRREQ